MASSGYVGLMAVVAVSGSVALVALRIHSHLTADFLDKVHSEINGGGERSKNPNVKKKKKKKKVRFAVDVVEPSCNN